MAKAGSVNWPKNKKLQTDKPLAEKDEEKQAEEEQHKTGPYLFHDSLV